MALLNYYLVSSYRSVLCTAMECYLRVSRLFLLLALSSESPLSIAPLTLNSALLLLNAARLPRACAPAVLPHASDLSTPCQASLQTPPWRQTFLSVPYGWKRSQTNVSGKLLTQDKPPPGLDDTFNG